jgi:tight adherence protein C
MSIGGFVLARRWGTAAALIAAAAAVLIPIALPASAAVVVGAATVAWQRRFRARRLAAETADADVVVLADLIVLGLHAGLGLLQAMEHAAAEVSAPLAAEVRGHLRTAELRGAAAALAGAGGRARRLYRLAARAAATGAPLAPAVEAFAAERRHGDHSRAVEATRRLPVRILVPLALLILPGFVVLAVGPALLEALARLHGAP